MKRNIKYSRIFGSLVIIICTVATIICVNNITQRKNLYYNSNYPVTSTFEGFYDIPHDTLDVLFMGSSVVVNGIIPQVLYDNYGIKSYVLASQQQSLLTSYYWLLEALKTQKPKCVVLETRYIYEGTAEEYMRLATDPMKISLNKIRYVNDICNSEENQSFSSYFLKNIRYTNRWKELTEEDFDKDKKKENYLLGFGPFPYIETTEFTPYIQKDKNERMDISEDRLERLNDIVRVCKENSIQLILYTTPRTMTDGMHNTLQEYADNNNLEYWDFNEEEKYKQFDIKDGETVINHSNIQGAVKLSRVIGKYLDDYCVLDKSKNDYWEANEFAYKQLINDINLCNIQDFDEYLEALNSWNYSIFMAINDEGTRNLTPKDLELLNKIGVETPLQDCFRKSYYFYKDAFVKHEEVSDSGLSRVYAFDNGKKNLAIISNSFGAGSTQAKIEIEGVDYAVNSRGLNIVVYDNLFNRVVDSVCFDTFESRAAVHKSVF